MTNAIERLETWKSKHKARYCVIDIDDGYGATCWRVKLVGERLPNDNTEPTHPNLKRRTVIDAAECAFTGPSGEASREEWERDMPVTEVFACPPWEEMDDWPGLSKTIHAAIDRWEKLSGEG